MKIYKFYLSFFQSHLSKIILLSSFIISAQLIKLPTVIIQYLYMFANLYNCRSRIDIFSGKYNHY